MCWACSAPGVAFIEYVVWNAVNGVGVAWAWAGVALAVGMLVCVAGGTTGPVELAEAWPEPPKVSPRKVLALTRPGPPPPPPPPPPPLGLVVDAPPMPPPPLLVLAGGVGGCAGGVDGEPSGCRDGRDANAASNAVVSCWLNGDDEKLSSDAGLVLAAV